MFGTDATLDVATWNIEWFGASGGPSDDARQLDLVEAVIEGAGIDLWALQEIAGLDAFNRLLDSLGTAYEGVYGENTSSGVTQRIAFVYDPAVIRVRRVEQLLREFSTGDDNPFAYRPPLKLDADVTLPDTTVAVSFITVHMKADGDLASYERRKEAARRLKNRIDGLYANARLVILGDFNDELGRSISGGRPTPYEVFLNDPDNYRFLTLPLDEANVPTYCDTRGNSTSCSSGSTLDHILITNELFGAYVDGSAGRFDGLLQAIPSFVVSTSDHLPVHARFAFEPSGTSVEGDLPWRNVVLQPVAPNPVRDRAVLRFTLEAPGPVRLDVHDLLGRSVAVVLDGYRAAGAHEVTFDASVLPGGVYLVRLEAGGYTAVRRMVRVR